MTASGKRRFVIELIKPSHYDDDGYVIQWAKAWVPSNTLSSLYGITLDVIGRKLLGDDVEVVLNGYDETNTIIPVADIIGRLTAPGTVGCAPTVLATRNDNASSTVAADVPVPGGSVRPGRGALAGEYAPTALAGTLEFTADPLSDLLSWAGHASAVTDSLPALSASGALDLSRGAIRLTEAELGFGQMKATGDVALGFVQEVRDLEATTEEELLLQLACDSCRVNEDADRPVQVGEVG